MKCPNCGELKPIQVIATISTKRPTKEIAYFCGKCGARLEEEAQLTPIQDVCDSPDETPGTRTSPFIQDVIRGRFDTAKPIEVLFEWTDQGIKERVL